MQHYRQHCYTLSVPTWRSPIINESVFYLIIIVTSYSNALRTHPLPQSDTCDSYAYFIFSYMVFLCFAKNMKYGCELICSLWKNVISNKLAVRPDLHNCYDKHVFVRCGERIRALLSNCAYLCQLLARFLHFLLMMATIFILVGAEKFVTKVLSKTLNPTWNECFEVGFWVNFCCSLSGLLALTRAQLL